MKNTKRNTIIVFLITLVILFFVIKDDYRIILDNLIQANKWLIIGAIVLLFVYYLLRTLVLYKIAKEYNKKIKFKNIFNQTLITQFFNGVTPFSTGGQPMQVYMLKKSGIKISMATNIIVQEFILYQTALIVMGVICLLANFKYNFFDVSPVLFTLIMLGFIINILVGVILVFISFSKKFNNFVGKLIIKLGAKVKIIKNKEEVIEKWEEKLQEFTESSKLFKKKKLLFISCFLYQLIGLIIFYVIPFFIIKSLGADISLNILGVITASAFVLIIGNFVPIPGGSGGIEYGFSKFFSSIVSENLVSSSLIIWRFVTYYVGMIIGGICWVFYKGDDKTCE